MLKVLSLKKNEIYDLMDLEEYKPYFKYITNLCLTIIKK